MPLSPFIALTDKNWFDHLKVKSNADSIVDEANFWSPKAQTPPAKMDPGQPVFLRLKSPYYAIAGVGFYTAFHVLPMDEAWQLFQWRNGDDTVSDFYKRIRQYRRDETEDEILNKPLGCMVLRSVELWNCGTNHAGSRGALNKALQQILFEVWACMIPRGPLN